MMIVMQKAALGLAGLVGLIGPWLQPNARAQESVQPTSARLEAASTSTAAIPGASGGPVTIPTAEQFDLRSKSGLEYRIFVAGPPGNAAPAAGAPVIYLSDGNSNFPVLLAAARRQSRDALQAVVVGIGYPSDEDAVHRERRAVDLTSGESSQAGGNDRFLTFIEEELKPVIERKYKIDRRRQTLFGHSFGGLFVLHVLFNKPEAFQTYLASSPSIWWNDGGILNEEKAFLQRGREQTVEARVLISTGEWEQNSSRSPNPTPASSDSKKQAEVLKKRRMVGNARELAARLAAAPIKGLTVTYREFAEEHHGSVVLPAASRGVRFALDGK